MQVSQHNVSVPHTHISTGLPCCGLATEHTVLCIVVLCCVTVMLQDGQCMLASDAASVPCQPLILMTLCSELSYLVIMDLWAHVQLILDLLYLHL